MFTLLESYETLHVKRTKFFRAGFVCPKIITKNPVVVLQRSGGAGAKRVAYDCRRDLSKANVVIIVMINMLIMMTIGSKHKTHKT